MFRDIPDGKECFLDKKSKVLKKFQKIAIFAKGVVYGFRQKMAFSMVCFFPQNKPETMFSDLLDRKDYFLDKKISFENSIHSGNFPKGLVNGFCQKKAIFHFFLL